MATRTDPRPRPVKPGLLLFVQRQIGVTPQRHLVLTHQVIAPVSLETFAGDAFADPAAELGKQFLAFVAKHLEYSLNFVAGNDLGDMAATLAVNHNQSIMHMAKEVVVIAH